MAYEENVLYRLTNMRMHHNIVFFMVLTSAALQASAVRDPQAEEYEKLVANAREFNDKKIASIIKKDQFKGISTIDASNDEEMVKEWWNTLKSRDWNRQEALKQRLVSDSDDCNKQKYLDRQKRLDEKQDNYLKLYHRPLVYNPTKKDSNHYCAEQFGELIVYHWMISPFARIVYMLGRWCGLTDNAVVTKNTDNFDREKLPKEGVWVQGIAWSNSSESACKDSLIKSWGNYYTEITIKNNLHTVQLFKDLLVGTYKMAQGEHGPFAADDLFLCMHDFFIALDGLSKIEPLARHLSTKDCMTPRLPSYLSRFASAQKDKKIMQELEVSLKAVFEESAKEKKRSVCIQDELRSTFESLRRAHNAHTQVAQAFMALCRAAILRRYTVDFTPLAKTLMKQCKVNRDILCEAGFDGLKNIPESDIK